VDNLTHSLFALTLAATPLGRTSRGATAALVIASNAPDIDIIATAGGSLSYLQWHRGPTHGPLGFAGLSVLTAVLVWVFARFSKEQTGDPPLSFPLLLAVSVIGVLLHLLMDLPTSYGTRLISPFDWHWFALDWLPIVDIYLLIALIAGLVFGRLSPGARRRNASIALVLMAANYGLRGAAHHRALALAPRLFGPTLPAACGPAQAGIIESWPRVAPSAPPAAGKRCLVELAAVPTFFSPFKWRVIAQLSDAYELHDIDLLDTRVLTGESIGIWRTSVRFPDIWTPIVETAARTRTAQAFLGFSRFPDARWFTDPKGMTTVRWTDARFAGGLFRIEQQPPRALPFTVTVRVGPDGSILMERIEP